MLSGELTECQRGRGNKLAPALLRGAPMRKLIKVAPVNYRLALAWALALSPYKD